MLKKLRGAFGRKEVSFAIGGTELWSSPSRARESGYNVHEPPPHLRDSVWGEKGMTPPGIGKTKIMG